MPEVSLQNVKALWIDVDNTLLDFRKCADECSAKCFADWNLYWDPSYSEVFHTLNNGLWKRIEKKEMDLEKLKQIRWNLILEQLGIKGVNGVEFEMRFRHYLNTSHVPVDGALQALKQLQEHYALFVISNGPSTQQKTRLALAGMDGFFQGIFTSEELEVSKPDPVFFEKALKMSQAFMPGLQKNEILVIGDSLTADINGSLNAGFSVVWFDLHSESSQKKMPVPVFTDWSALTEALIQRKTLNLPEEAVNNDCESD